MTRCAMFAGAMAICAWLAVPLGQGAVTMQTLGLFLAVGLLGGRRGLISVIIYLSLGVAGLPVFSGFQGGFGIILGPTGGFLLGFLVAAGVCWLTEKSLPLWLRLILCQLIIYICGLGWFCVTCGSSLWTAAGVTIVPYLLPDAAKLTLSLILIRKLNYRLAA